MVNREIEGGRNEEAAEVLGDGGHEGENLGVVAQLHALFAEVVPNVGVHPLRMGEKNGAPAVGHKISHKDGIVLDIGRPEVEQPSDFSQFAHNEKRFTLSLPLLCAEVFDLFTGRLGDIFIGLAIQRRLRQRRAVRPDFAERVGRGAEQAGRKDSGQTFVEIQSAGFGTEADAAGRIFRSGCFCHQSLLQPIGKGGGGAFSLAHQFKGSVEQLLFGLEKIAAVGPEGCMMEGDKSGSGTSVKTTDPFAALPVRSRILTVVRVGRGDDECLEILAAHPVAQGGNAVGNAKKGCVHRQRKFFREWKTKPRSYFGRKGSVA